MKRRSQQPPRPDPEHAKLISADKPFPANWWRALRQRGQPRIYSGEDLRYIGMPISGICTGQVYLSGDGRLCHWDVFKSYGGRTDSGDPRGPHYANPQVPDQPFAQGFAIHCEGDRVRRLDASGFATVEFSGTYPIGTVRYTDPICPVSVELEAFSPFVPLEPDDSGLPLVLLHYRIRNKSTRAVQFATGGWLQNHVCPFSPSPRGARVTDALVAPQFAGVTCTAEIDPDQSPDGNGSMTLAILEPLASTTLRTRVEPNPGQSLEELALEAGSTDPVRVRVPFGSESTSALSCRSSLEAGSETTVVFAVAWYFPAYTGGRVFFSTMESLPGLTRKRRYYSRRFSDSTAVIAYVAQHRDRLSALTRSWTRTWYDSSLPYWFLDRTFLNVSVLATQTCHRFDDGRFYGWEGVDSCPGTCQHVWMYAQAVAHVFPSLERDTRERVDFGIAYHADGSLDYRAEGSSHGEQVALAPVHSPGEAIIAADGMSGTIIRVYREHKMSPNAEFLKRLWPKVRKSIAFMMTMDKDEDGLLEGPQYNTLDSTWFGRIPSISSLFLGALAVGEAMATEMRDDDFARLCERRLQAGRDSFVAKLFNGLYFEHEPDPTQPDSISLDDGCYIDQLLGQSFGHQVGYARIVPAAECRSALQSIWKFNLAPDVGAYREGFKRVRGGRWYAMPGEPGIIMCTWPLENPQRESITHVDMGLGVSAEAYLNECMNGFEYQVAAHMIGEGLVDEGLAVTRVIDERYSATKRNPWNEVECGDHYSRSMASFGVFITACGIDYHGPKQTIGFDPKIAPEDFRCAALLAEGWGTYRQQFDSNRFEANLTLKYGRASLKHFVIHPHWSDGPVTVRVTTTGMAHPPITTQCVGGRVSIELPAAARSLNDDPRGMTLTVESRPARIDQ